MRTFPVVLALLALSCLDPEVGVATFGVDRGLNTTTNPYALEPGYLTQADNATYDRPGIIGPRRGFLDLGVTALVGANYQSGTFFQDKLVVQHGTSSLSYVDGSTRTALSGTFTPPTGRRIRWVQANKNLYFTTADGIKKMTSYSATPEDAGGVRALYATVSATGTSGFLTALRSTGYRHIWSRKDANDNVLQGPPSQFEIVTNSAVATSVAGQVSRAASTVTVNTAAAHGLSTGYVVWIDSDDVNFPSGEFTVTVTDADTFTYTQAGSATSSTSEIAVAYANRDVSVTVKIPSEITDPAQGWYCEVFRSYDQTADSTSSPSDELGKVYEYYPTSLDIAAGEFTFTDSTPDALVQTPLYTNAGEEGLLQENSPPPFARDIAHWGGHAWYASTEQQYVFTLTLLSLTDLVTNGADLTFKDADETDLLRAAPRAVAEAGGDPNPVYYQVYSDGTAAENLANTAKSLVRVVNSVIGSSGITAYYVSGPNDAPGTVVFRGASYFFVHTETTESVRRYAPDLSREGPVECTRASDVVTADFGASHNLQVGQQIYVWDAAGIADGSYAVVSVVSASKITFSAAGTDIPVESPVTGSARVGTRAEAESEAVSNRLYYSKYGQPEAVPTLNYVDVGDPTDSILRIVPLRDSLFIFMEKGGLYRLTGSEPFSLELFDSTVRLVGTENLVVVQNYIWPLTRKGVTPISESGVGQPVSTPIKKSLLDLLASAETAVETYGTAAGYESDRKVIFFLPSASSDTKATQAYVYHLDAKAWTRWTGNVYTAIHDETNDLLYISRGTTLSKERKARAAADHQDESGAAISYRLQWPPIVEGDPATFKQFSEASLQLVDAAVTAVTLGFATDWSTSETTVSVAPPGTAGTSYSYGPIRTFVPLEKQRAHELRVSAAHAVAGEVPSIANLKVVYKVDAQASGR